MTRKRRLIGTYLSFVLLYLVLNLCLSSTSVLAQAHTLSTFIRDRNGNGVAQAKVILTISGTETVKYSGPNGEVLFDALAFGSDYVLRASAAGHSSDVLNGTIAGNSTQTLTISPTTFTLSGTVMDSSKRRMAGVVVNAGVHGNATTDSNGNFSLQILHGSEFTLNAAATDYHFNNNGLKDVMYGNQQRVLVAIKN